MGAQLPEADRMEANRREADRIMGLSDEDLIAETIAADQQSTPYPGSRSLTRSAVDLWMSPIRGQMDLCALTIKKPLGELTMPELLAWGICLSYGAMTGYVIGKVTANLVEVAVRGRR